MAATATAAKLSANLDVKVHTGTADISTATDILFSDETSGSTIWLDMRDYEHIMFLVLLSDRTDNIEEVVILSNNTNAGGGTDTTVVSQTGLTTEANAAGDYIVAEATAEQMGGLRYCTVKVKTGNASDRVVVVAIRGQARFPASGLTATYTS